MDFLVNVKQGHCERFASALALMLRSQGIPSRVVVGFRGVIALHDHGHYKLSGKEKIADGPDGPLHTLERFRQTSYGGRGYANQLGREGLGRPRT